MTLSIGIHSTRVNNSIIKGWEYDIKNYGSNASQIWASSSRSKSMPKIKEAGVIPTFVRKTGLRYIVHFPYVFNIWKSEEDQALLIKYISTIDDLGAEGIVVHLGKNSYTEIVRIMAILEPMRAHLKTPILLENHAYRASEENRYETPVKFIRLRQALDEAKVTNWGYCIDTAHLWGSIGKDERKHYSIETREGMQQWIDDLSADPLTVNKVKWIHFNGSLVDHSSGRDKHAMPMSPTDKMWYTADTLPLYVNYDRVEVDYTGIKSYIENSAVGVIVRFAKQYNIPLIMEIAGNNKIEAVFRILKTI